MDARGEDTTTATAKALAMLFAFGSIGAQAFNLTPTDITGEKMPGGYRPNRSLREMRRTMGFFAYPRKRPPIQVSVIT
jgi:hypothetical protein